MAGHHPSTMMGASFYSGTKFAVTALTEGLRKELRDIKSNIKITVRHYQSDLHYNSCHRLFLLVYASLVPTCPCT